MSKSTLRYVAVVVLMLTLPSIAKAGDCPIVTFGNWGVGKIDGKLMFYLGKNRFLETVIPAPPEGPRWNVTYHALPYALGLTGSASLLMRRRPRTGTN